MRTWIHLTSTALLAMTCGCTPSTSIDPPSSWVKIANARFDFCVPPDMNTFGLLDTNSLHGQSEGKSMFLSFEYGLSQEDYSGFTKAKHYASHEERIGGRTAKIVEFYYEPFLRYHELIAVDFPRVDGKEFQLNVTAICSTTNDYETARKIFRTIRFK